MMMMMMNHWRCELSFYRVGSKTSVATAPDSEIALSTVIRSKVVS